MLDQDQILQRVLNAYDVGTISDLAGAGGTAGKTWRVRAESGEYLLRLRGTRTSSPAQLAYDHGLRAHLVARGVPTTCAVPTREGAQWVRAEGRVYELIHRVNSMRKDAGLELTDRIVLTVAEGDGDLLEHRDWIARETLAADVELGDGAEPAIRVA